MKKLTLTDKCELLEIIKREANVYQAHILLISRLAERENIKIEDVKDFDNFMESDKSKEIYDFYADDIIGIMDKWKEIRSNTAEVLGMKADTLIEVLEKQLSTVKLDNYSKSFKATVENFVLDMKKLGK